MNTTKFICALILGSCLLLLACSDGDDSHDDSTDGDWDNSYQPDDSDDDSQHGTTGSELAVNTICFDDPNYGKYCLEREDYTTTHRTSNGNVWTQIEWAHSTSDDSVTDLVDGFNCDLDRGYNPRPDYTTDVIVGLRSYLSPSGRNLLSFSIPEGADLPYNGYDVTYMTVIQNTIDNAYCDEEYFSYDNGDGHEVGCSDHLQCQDHEKEFGCFTDAWCSSAGGCTEWNAVICADVTEMTGYSWDCSLSISTVEPTSVIGEISCEDSEGNETAQIAFNLGF